MAKRCPHCFVEIGIAGQCRLCNQFPRRHLPPALPQVRRTRCLQRPAFAIRAGTTADHKVVLTLLCRGETSRRSCKRKNALPATVPEYIAQYPVSSAIIADTRIVIFSAPAAPAAVGQGLYRNQDATVGEETIKSFQTGMNKNSPKLKKKNIQAMAERSVSKIKTSASETRRSISSSFRANEAAFRRRYHSELLA